MLRLASSYYEVYLQRDSGHVDLRPFGVETDGGEFCLYDSVFQGGFL